MGRYGRSGEIWGDRLLPPAQEAVVRLHQHRPPRAALRDGLEELDGNLIPAMTRDDPR